MRISRHQLFMGIAQLAAQRSTCFRMSVGAVIVFRNRPISMGYNGAPAGEEHCLGNECPLSENGGCTRSVHAERNAIDYIPGALLHCRGLSLYATHSPCSECADMIRHSNNIERLFYLYEYRIPDALDWIMRERPGMGVYRMTSSGYVIDRRTNEIVDIE